ncbi:ABC transporter substrate-binding protein [Paramicrobacterium fandaimingii]|uniref:ABC transporter substrate-binding protein n=1 Tax=Paramicrobacterium fandaimingii TaxID=2708079 RepID=UPI001422D762|nr:sugar ABC transporter substrate-binding protein [Microbacterium fandaimingii]
MTSHTARNSRRAIAALAAAIMIPALAACGGSSASGSGGAGEVKGSSIVLTTITGLEPQFQKYADAYMEAFPDRKVEVRSTTDDAAEYAQQLATARLSGELPDVFFNVDFLADTLAENKVTLDLAPGLKEGKLGDLDADSFLPQFVGQYRPLADPDKITGLPVSADSVGLFYNKSVFDELGVTEYPQADWTWDDMYRVAEEIQDKSGDTVTGLGAPLGDGSDLIVFGPVIKAFGGTVFDPETGKSGIGQPEALKAWELLLDAYGTASGPYTTTTDDPSLKFESGNVAMAIASRGAVPGLQTTLVDDDWDVQTMPTINGKSTAGGGSYGLSIAQTSENQDAAWAFMAWFYDTDTGMKVAQDVGGVIPPTDNGIDNGTWKDGAAPPEHIEIFGDSAREAVLIDQMPGSSSTTLKEATKKATQEVVLNGMSIEEAFGAAEKTVNEAIEKESK